MQKNIKAEIFAAKQFACSNIITKRGSTLPVRRLVRRSSAEIKRLYRSLKDTQNSYYKECAAWLGDNCYLFDSASSRCEKSLKAHKKVACTCDGVPFVFGVLEAYLGACRDAPSEGTFAELVKYMCENFGQDVYFCDLYSLGDFATAAVICKLGKSCKQFADNASKDSAKGLCHVLKNSVKLLKDNSVFDMSELFCCSRSEQILCADPVGAYANMDELSKKYYRMSLCALALKLEKSEAEVAQSLLDRAKQAKALRKRHVGYYLTGKSNAGTAYFWALFGLGFFVLTSLCLKCSPWCIFAAFPVFEGVKYLCDRVFSMVVKPKPLFSLEYEQIPKGSGVMTVITSLLCGDVSDKELFDRLERLYCSNGGDNIYFGVLADLCDSNTQTYKKDNKALEYARHRIDDLNAKYENVFFLFTRQRQFSETQNKYIAPERKRGAVLCLDKLLCCAGNDFDKNAVLPCEEICENIKYVVTLDSDTNVPLGGILKMAGAMMHPLNAPVVDKDRGVVVKGHGIMQPAVSPTLFAAGKNVFTRIMCGGGGRESYSSVQGDLWQTLFGFSGFCGKGIFDKNVFYELMCKEDGFPKNKILSHDAPEGAILRCGFLGGVQFTDGFPKNELSYFKREHRWIRGDFQNLMFVLPNVKNAVGQVKRNNICAVAKFRMLDSVRRELTPVFAAASIVISCFLKGNAADLLCLFALLYTLLPFMADLCMGLTRLRELTQSAGREFYSPCLYGGIWQSLFVGVNDIVMLAKSACVSLDGAARSIYRTLVSKRNLLEWTTAAQSDAQSKDGIPGYVSGNIFGCILGVLVFVLCPSALGKLSGLTWFLCPFIQYSFSSSILYKKGGFSKAKKGVLCGYARDIWSFFEYTVTTQENHLPVDNLQLFPGERVAHRTSPTNIGLYLVSVLCARLFDFIDTQTLCQRLENTLDTIESLEKYKGHLYNWYDTKSLLVLQPKYISSVDSGNLLGCILCLYEGLDRFYDGAERILQIKSRLKRLFDSADLNVLYNQKKNLFCIGLEEKNGAWVQSDNCYDLYMSEARTLSFIAQSHRKVSCKHWQSLSRSAIKNRRKIGLVSWSGTAFEYFMPVLFLPVEVGSFDFEALSLAYTLQKRRVGKYGDKQVWGISESGYFAFDSAMNYQYKAFGVPELSLANKKSDLVVSPYSSFLFLALRKQSTLYNLARLKECGLYGKFGFYEAWDFEKQRIGSSKGCVESYMAHHMGMSLCAACNACFENVLVRLFMKNPQNASGAELLTEKIPVSAFVKKVKRAYPALREDKSKSYPKASVFVGCNPQDPRVMCLSDGRLCLDVSDTGYAAMKSGNVLLGAVSNDRYTVTKSLLCFARVGDKVIGAGQSPIFDGEARYSTEQSLSRITQRVMFCDKRGARCVLSVRYTLENNALRVGFELKCAKSCAPVEFGLYFEPLLCDLLSHISHPAFSGLFTETFMDKATGCLVFHRRAREENGFYAAVGLCSSEEKFDFCISKNQLFDYPLTWESFLHIFKKPCKNRLGACIDPCCFIRVKPQNKGNGLYTSELLVSLDRDREGAVMGISACRQSSFEKADKLLFEKSLSLYAAAKYAPDATEDFEKQLLKAYIYPESIELDGEIRAVFGMDTLWRHGISGDMPIVCVYADNPLTKWECGKLLKAFMLLKYKKHEGELVMLYSDGDKYSAQGRHICEDIVRSCGAESFVGQRGGVFFVNTYDLQKGDEEKLLKAASFIYPQSFRRAYTPYGFDKKQIVTSVQDFNLGEVGELDTNAGYFGGDGSFTVDKARNISSPMSHVLSGYNFSSVVTHMSLGYSFYKNAGLCRLTPFYNDIFGLECGEHIYIESGTALYDLCAVSRYVKYGSGFAKYTGQVEGKQFTLCVFIPKKLPVKIISLECGEGCKVIFTAKPAMGRFENSRRISFCVGGGAVRFYNSFEEDFTGCGFVTGVCAGNDGQLYECKLCHFEGGRFGDSAGVISQASGDGRKNVVFAVGYAKDDRVISHMVGALYSEPGKLFESANSFGDSFFNRNKLYSPIHGKAAMALCYSFGNWLPYQNAICRFFARSGFYQSGGAYGFRDQLQDSLCLMHFNTELAKAHIIRCAAHQFEEGDVLHWWHPCTQKGNVSHKGVRTRVSDDYLWLPFVVNRYVDFTGDVGLLDVNVRYIKAPVLDDGLLEAYIAPRVSDVKESIYRHCLKSIFRCYKLRGDRGLCLMGSGDWSDGLNAVGKAGKGQSVWLTMFLAYCMKEFSKTALLYGDEVTSETLCEKSAQLFEVCMKEGFDSQNGYFVRAYSDNGEVIGRKDCDECKIDLLPQSFCALSAGFDKGTTVSCLTKMYEMLYDKEYRILKLLHPPFDKTKTDVGYIKGYVAGIRENGGQYTHASVWGCMAFFEAAQRFCADKELSLQLSKMGADILEGLLPAYRCSKEKLAKAYKTEPYVLCGDVYTHPHFYGNGGWSWYSGSAGWLYRCILQSFFCIKPVNVLTEEIKVEIGEGAFRFPFLLSDEWCLQIKLFEGVSVNISYKKAQGRALTVNGKALQPCEGKTAVRLVKGQNTIDIVS